MRFGLLASKPKPDTPPPSRLRLRVLAWVEKGERSLGAESRVALKLIRAGLASIPDEKLQDMCVAVHAELASMLTDHFLPPTDDANKRD